MASFWYCTEIRATRCIFLVLHRFCRIMVLFPEHMRMPVSSTSSCIGFFSCTAAGSRRLTGCGAFRHVDFFSISCAGLLPLLELLTASINMQPLAESVVLYVWWVCRELTTQLAGQDAATLSWLDTSDRRPVSMVHGTATSRLTHGTFGSQHTSPAGLLPAHLILISVCL